MPLSRRNVRTMLVGVMLAILVAAGFFAIPSRSSAQTQQTVQVQRTPPDEGLEDFMKAKLAAINAAMEAASMDNYPAIERAGLDLVQLSKQSAWNKLANAAYLQDTADFVDSAKFMIRMAEAEDSQGVANSFGAVSVCCLNCHRHVRTPKVAAMRGQSDHQLALVD